MPEIHFSTVDEAGVVVDVQSINFARVDDAVARSMLDQLNALTKVISRKREVAKTYRRLCDHITSKRNAHDHARLFRIRYEGSKSSDHPCLEPFLKLLPIGAFISVIFKISYADLVTIEEHLKDLSLFVHRQKINLAQRHKDLLHDVVGYQKFYEEYEAAKERAEEFAAASMRTSLTLFRLPQISVVARFSRSVNATLDHILLPGKELARGTKRPSGHWPIERRIFLALLSRMLDQGMIQMYMDDEHGTINLASAPDKEVPFAWQIKMKLGRWWRTKAMIMAMEGQGASS